MKNLIAQKIKEAIGNKSKAAKKQQEADTKALKDLGKEWETLDNKKLDRLN